MRIMCVVLLAIFSSSRQKRLSALADDSRQQQGHDPPVKMSLFSKDSARAGGGGEIPWRATLGSGVTQDTPRTLHTPGTMPQRAPAISSALSWDSEGSETNRLPAKTLEYVLQGLARRNSPRSVKSREPIPEGIMQRNSFGKFYGVSGSRAKLLVRRVWNEKARESRVITETGPGSLVDLMSKILNGGNSPEADGRRVKRLAEKRPSLPDHRAGGVEGSFNPDSTVEPPGNVSVNQSIVQLQNESILADIYKASRFSQRDVTELLEQKTNPQKVLLLYLFSFMPGVILGYSVVAICFFLRHHRCLFFTARCERRLMGQSVPEKSVLDMSQMQVSTRHSYKPTKPKRRNVSKSRHAIARDEREKRFKKDKANFKKTGKDPTTGLVVTQFVPFKDDPTLSRQDWMTKRMTWWLINERSRCLRGIYTDPNAAEEGNMRLAIYKGSSFDQMSDQVTSISELIRKNREKEKVQEDNESLSDIPTAQAKRKNREKENVQEDNESLSDIPIAQAKSEDNVVSPSSQSTVSSVSTRSNTSNTDYSSHN